jgi:pimeloyl-ACP methyl ester carboxylesterase
MSSQAPPHTDAHLWRSPTLGANAVLELPQGRLECFIRGEGPALVFAHGWLTNANLWRKVVAALSGRFRCIALDLPLGAHRRAMPAAADLTPAGCGELICAAIEELGLEDVTLIGNDSGGAYSQIAVASRPALVARLVLNSCETPYGEFPPAPFDGLPAIATDISAFAALLEALADRPARSAEAAFGLLAKHPLENAASDSYALPALRDPAVLRDFAAVVASASSRPVQDAGRALIAGFPGRTLLAWSPEDRVFAAADAERYAAALARGRLALIDDAYSFTPEDQPERLAEAIAAWHGSEAEPARAAA